MFLIWKVFDIAVHVFIATVMYFSLSVAYIEFIEKFYRKWRSPLFCEWTILSDIYYTYVCNVNSRSFGYGCDRCEEVWLCFRSVLLYVVVVVLYYLITQKSQDIYYTPLLCLFMFLFMRWYCLVYFVSASFLSYFLHFRFFFLQFIIFYCDNLLVWHFIKCKYK